MSPWTRLWTRFWNSPVLLLTLTAATWAGHAVVGRMAVGEIGPMTLVTARWAVALVPILYVARRDLRRDFDVLRQYWLYVGAMGGFGFTAFNAMFYLAGHRTGALNVSIIQGAIPAFVLVGARFGLGERVTALQAVGAFATMIGVVAIASQGAWSRLARLEFNSGDVLMLVASVFYAGYTLGLRKRPNVTGLSLLAGFAVAALLTSLPLFGWEVASGGFIWPTGKGLVLVAYAALGVAFVSQRFYMRGVELIGPGRAGVFVNLVPAFGALMAVALLGEPFAYYHVAALALVVGGIAVAQRQPRRAR